MSVQMGTITTRVPARLDRLRWSGWHWRVVIGLGTVWILDGLEVTIVGAIAGRLIEAGSGLELTEGQAVSAGLWYVAGACIGAIFFGQLTDRLGRKKMFMVTLAVYLVGTVATAFSFDAWYFFLMRFITGAGIGGEYAAINSAIDELIPARVRGRVDLIINGSFWLGAIAGGGLGFLFLDTDIFAIDIGWRLAFASGAILGIGILIIRRLVPESPRWLFIHGREDEAERIVDDVENRVKESTGRTTLPEPDRSITVRQRKSIPLRQVFATAFSLYPKRSVLGLSLFIGQAFLYNAIFFSYVVVLTSYLGVDPATAPLYIIPFAVGNFLGPLLLGPLFDTIGRKPMIAGTYILAGALLFVTALLFRAEVLTATTQTIAYMVVFFFASAGASSAYLTVSEIFPMETLALFIAIFYAVGTAAGGISGTFLFSKLVETESQLFFGYALGAALMILAGIVEIFIGVKAEQRQLEDIAKPLTAQEAEEGAGPGGPAPATAS